MKRKAVVTPGAKRKASVTAVRARPGARPRPTTTTMRTSKLRPVTTTLPRSHHQIIETESHALGLKKNQFLSMLVRRRAGLSAFTRMGPGAKYEFSEDDLSAMSRYVWLVDPDTYQMFVEQCRGAGGISPQPYLIHLLHDWIGKRTGFKKDSDGKYW